MRHRSSQRNEFIALSVFVIARAVQTLAIFIASDLLHNHSLPILLYSFFILAGSSLIFLTIQRAWSFFRYASHRQLVILSVNGLGLIVITSLFALGLKYCGPIRVILLSFFEYPIASLYLLLSGSGRLLPGNKRRGGIVMLIVLVIIILTPEQSAHDATSLAPSQPPVVNGMQFPTLGGAAASASESIITVPGQSSEGGLGNLMKASAPIEPIISTARRLAQTTAGPAVVVQRSHEFGYGPFIVSEGMVGCIALLLAIMLNLYRGRYVTRYAKAFDGSKRLHALSTAVAAALLSPIAIIYLLFGEPIKGFASSHTMASSSSLFGTILFSTLFLHVNKFYNDAIGHRLDQRVMIAADAIASLLSAVFVNHYRQEELLSWNTIMCSVATLYGLYQILFVKRDSITNSTLPMYSKSEAPRHGALQLRLIYKHIMESQETKRIFIFLVINFLFMFVELLYGVLTNSLGLISDAGHMLFDCAALGIGLYASYISKIKANSTFTYGYGRYETVSGLVNGIFLLFIGFFVFLEAIERIFEPPDISTNNLITVSVLGFLVNMVGLFFFHDHHGHSHGGHGHSHGGHGHAHGETKPKAHSHGGHGHAHGEAEHGHSHGHGHANDTHGHESHGHSHGAHHDDDGDDEEGRNLNVEGIFLHVLADTLGSVGVIISSLLIYYFNWTMADAICSIFISVLIILSVIPLIKASSKILLQRVPEHKERSLRKCLNNLATLPSVTGYRVPHFWEYADGNVVGSIHIHVEEEADHMKVLNDVSSYFHNHGFGVGNNQLCIQIEKEQFLLTLRPDERLSHI